MEVKNSSLCCEYRELKKKLELHHFQFHQDVLAPDFIINRTQTEIVNLIGYFGTFTVAEIKCSRFNSTGSKLYPT